MAIKKSSGADWNSGNVRTRSTKSRGISLIVEAVSGEGRMGREGFVSTLKERIRETGSAVLEEALASW